MTPSSLARVCGLSFVLNVGFSLVLGRERRRDAAHGGSWPHASGGALEHWIQAERKLYFKLENNDSRNSQPNHQLFGPWSSFWQGEALGTRAFEVYSFHCCGLWQIALLAVVFPEQFEISWVYSFMSTGVQELVSSGENKYRNPEAQPQRETSLRKSTTLEKGVHLGCLVFLVIFWLVL